MSSKTSQTSGLKEFQGLISFNISGGSGTVNSKMGIRPWRLQLFKETKSFQVFHGMRDLFKGIKNPRFTVPGQRFSKFRGLLRASKFSGFQGLKGLILECLHLSIHLCTAFYS